jgi:hypothetical protein
MKKRNSLYPIVHIPMFQVGGAKSAPEYADPAKFKPAVEVTKMNPDAMRFSDWYKAQLKAGKAGDVVTYRGKKILLDPRDFPGYKAPASPAPRPSTSNRPVAAPKPPNQVQNTVAINAPNPAKENPNNGIISKMIEGIDWLNERTGDNPLGAATRFVMNTIKAPFESARDLSYDVQPDATGKTNLGAHSAIDAAVAFSPALGKMIGSGINFAKTVPGLKGVLNQSINKLDDVIVSGIKRKQGALQRSLNEAAKEEAAYLRHIKNKQGYYQGMNNEAAREAAIIEERALQGLPKKVRAIANKQKKAELYQGGGMYIPMFDDESYMDEDYLYDDMGEMDYMMHGGMHMKAKNRNPTKMNKQAGGYIFKQLKS